MGQGGFLFSMCSHSGRSPPMVASSTKKCRSRRSRSDHQWVDHCGHEHHPGSPARWWAHTYFSWFRPLVRFSFHSFRPISLVWPPFIPIHIHSSIIYMPFCHTYKFLSSLFHTTFFPDIPSFSLSWFVFSPSFFRILPFFSLAQHLPHCLLIKKDSVWESFEAVFFCEQQQSYLHRCRQWILLVVYFDRSLLRTN